MATIDIKQRFLNTSSEKYGFDQSEIKKLLSEKYPLFSIDQLAEYDSYLADIKSKTKDVVRKGKKKELITVIPNMLCPICGSKIFNNDNLFGVYTRTPGWQCVTGKKLHFYQWKANNILRNRGKEPIFQEVPVVGSI